MDIREIDYYINRMTKKYPVINSIWLLGSRANGNPQGNSDWDILAFGNENILKSLESDVSFCQEKIDLFIVYEDKNFKQPLDT